MFCHGARCMFVPVDFQDGQVLKSQSCRKSLKSKVFFRYIEKSFGMNFLATNWSYLLSMAMRKSKDIESGRRGSFLFSDANLCWFRACTFVFECLVF